jgi:CheY-like chemotaxis protein
MPAPSPAPPPCSGPPPRPRPAPLIPPSPEAPLAGLTILLVEDSRFASDALRLIVQRCGGRLRRAETMAQARAHLRVYRPDAVIVDLGLPDGPGETLIAELVRRPDLAAPVIGLSGEDGAEPRARAAGACGFLAKPVGGIAAVCAALLPRLPDRAGLARTGGGAALPAADALALRDDLARAAALMAAGPAPGVVGYVAGFVAGVARSAADPGLAQAARVAADGGGPVAIGVLAAALAERLARPPAVVPGAAGRV